MQRPATAWVVLAISLALTAIAWQFSLRTVHESAQGRFQLQSSEAAAALNRRLRTYEMALRGGMGLFSASDRVTREEWLRYVAGLKLTDNYPGIQGIGYTQMIPPGELAAHEQEVRRDGMPDYAVRPAGPRELYSAIVFLEPLDWRNRRAIGFDMYSEAVRREAMERARDSGEPALSGRVTLVQETEKDVQSGFLMYMPVYRKGMPTATPEQRRQALVGFVYAPFRASDFLNGVLGEDDQRIDIELYAGKHPSRQNVLVDTSPDTPLYALIPGHDKKFYRMLSLDQFQTSWSLFVYSQADFLTQVEVAQPLIVAFGGLVGDLILFAMALSQRREKNRVEVRATELANDLRESEERYTTLFVSSRAVMLLIDPDTGCIVDANPAAVEFYGYPRAQLLQMKISDINNLPSDEIRADMNHVRDASETHFEFQHRLASGEIRDVEVHSAVVYLAGQAVLFSIIHDITQRHRQEAELALARRQADEANLAKSRFLATMSHEIRTPMNGILGMAQMLLSPDMDEADRQDYARTILSSGQSLLALLNDILDLSKVESGKMQLVREPVDPTIVLHEVCQLFTPSANEKGLQLLGEWTSPAGRRYELDSHRVRQMLANLVSNAIKFTSRGLIRVEGHEVEVGANSAVLEFSVTDTGIGIPPDRQAMIFQPFVQAESTTARRFGGTGLGLSIVGNLASMMGGEAGVSSTPGEGARFWFRLRTEPVASDRRQRELTRMPDRRSVSPAASAVSPVLPAPPTVASPSLPVLSGRVLVVEDDGTNCQVITRLLSRLGLDSDVVENGQQAVEAVRSGLRPDLVLMDLNMPVMDGYEATRQLRQHESDQKLSRVPIVALTAAAFAEDRQRCLEAGMDDFLTKPLAVDALIAAIHRCCPACGQRQAMAVTTVATLPTEQLATQVGTELATQVAAAAESEGVLTTTDIIRMGELLREIIPLLEQNKFDAVLRFKELLALTEGTRHESVLGEASRHLSAFRFEDALKCVRSVMTAMEGETP